MEVIDVLQIFSRTSSPFVDAMGCVLAQAVKDLSVNFEEEEFIDFFHPANRQHLANSLLQLIFARWLNSSFIPRFDFKLVSCPHWFSEHRNVQEYLLFWGNFLDGLDSDA